MNILIDFVNGIRVGFELGPQEGVYLVLHLAIVDVAFVSKEFMEELND